MIGNRGTSWLQYAAAELFESELDDNTKACDHVHVHIFVGLVRLDKHTFEIPGIIQGHKV